MLVVNHGDSLRMIETRLNRDEEVLARELEEAQNHF